MQELLLRTLHWSRSCTSPWIQYWSNQLRPFLIVVVVVFVDCLSGGGDDNDYGGSKSKCSNQQQRQQINNNRSRTLVTRLDWAIGCFYKKRWKYLFPLVVCLSFLLRFSHLPTDRPFCKPGSFPCVFTIWGRQPPLFVVVVVWGRCANSLIFIYFTSRCPLIHTCN